MVRPALATAALLGALPVAACVEPALGTDTAPVIGGTPALAGQYPGVGALVIQVGADVSLGCTGTLIAPDAVLTAAHCVDPAITGGVIPGFTLALDLAAGPPLIVDGRQTFAHESFTFDVEPFDGLGTFYDIGLVLLATPITSVPPVRMPTPDQLEALTAGLALDIAGYGKTDVVDDANGVLYQARTTLVSLNDTELQVGMGAPEPQNCNGDSGGPAFADLGDGPRLVGVVSRSFAGSACTTGGVDTRVDAYLDWIQAKVPTGIPCGSGLACYVEDAGGCCSTGGDQGAPAALALAGVVAAAVSRRRRR